VRTLDVTIDDEEIVIEPKGAGDLSLEVWTARRKAELFEKTFATDVRFELAQTAAFEAEPFDASL